MLPRNDFCAAGLSDLVLARVMGILVALNPTKQLPIQGRAERIATVREGLVAPRNTDDYVGAQPPPSRRCNSSSKLSQRKDSHQRSLAQAAVQQVNRDLRPPGKNEAVTGIA
jgi:hypothetical protein